MPSMPSMIENILKTKSIVSYLEKRGIHPTKHLNSGRLAYICPFPDHQESKPSFIVYTEAEFENFYCFGCQSKYTIIDLVAKLEGISWKEAVQKLSDGMEISPETETTFNIRRGNKNLSDVFADPCRSIADNMLDISRDCRNYLESVHCEILECSIIDKFYKEIDDSLCSFDFEKIDDFSKHLRVVLKKRREKIERVKRGRE